MQQDGQRQASSSIPATSCADVTFVASVLAVGPGMPVAGWVGWGAGDTWAEAFIASLTALPPLPGCRTKVIKGTGWLML